MAGRRVRWDGTTLDSSGIPTRATTGSSASFTLSALRAGRTCSRVAPARSAATRIGTCSRERPRLRALPPRRRGLRSSFRLSRTKVSSVSTIPASRSGACRTAARKRWRQRCAVLGASPAALGGLPDRLACGKRGAEGQPALLVVKPRQRRAGERAECLPAGFAAIAAQAAAPCPATPHRRCRNADSAARHPRPARSPPERRRPPAGPTAPPRPPGAAPPSTHRHARTSLETAHDPYACPPPRIGDHSTRPC